MTATELQTDSPIEKMFLDAMLPLLHDGVLIRTQEWVSGGGRRRRVDFHLESNERVTVVECDGKDFHDFTADRIRDIGMIRNGGVHEVFRFRGCDIVFDRGACLAFFQTWAPNLFHEDSVPMPIEVRAIAAEQMRGMTIQPVCRTLVKIEEIRRVNGWKRSNCVSVLDANVIDAILQFKTPYFDRTNHGDMKAWHISDALQPEME